MGHRWAAGSCAVVLSVVLAGSPLWAGFSGSDVFLPSVGGAPGVSPSVWYTTVWVYNPNTISVQVEFRFLRRDTENASPASFTDTIPAGSVKRYDDAVETMFAEQGFGAIRVLCGQEVAVTSRIYSKATGEDDEDSVGQLFAGIPAELAIGTGETTELLGLTRELPAESAAFRYNFGFVETTGASVQLRLKALAADGTDWAHQDYFLRPFEQQQRSFNGAFPTLGAAADARLQVEVVSGNGKVIAFGSRLANGSQDPATFEMLFNEELLEGGGSTGTVTGVTAGEGLTGGGTSGTVTVNVGAGSGIEVSSDAVGLADLGVTTDKLADSTVTTPKLASINTPSHGDGLTFSHGVLAWLPPQGFTLPYSTSADVPKGTAFQITNTGNAGHAIHGISEDGIGVKGVGVSSDGVVGSSVDGNGVRGLSNVLSGVAGTSDVGEGVLGLSTSGYGVRGASDESYGVYGWGNSQPGVFGVTQIGVSGVFGRSYDRNGVFGESENGNGVHGRSDASNGVLGNSDSGTGVRGESQSGPGVHGSSDSDYGVDGYSYSSIGVSGESLSESGVLGLSSQGYGVEGLSLHQAGTYGHSVDESGVVGESQSRHGVYGKSLVSGCDGYVGGNGIAVFGGGCDTGIAVLGRANNGYAVRGQSSSGYAGYFEGDVEIIGNLNVTGGSKNFKIDHPLDPENRLLYHASVESSEVLNVYSGNVVLDTHGEAVVRLPEWFEALNRDFRYQLTAIGTPAVLYVAEEIADGRFVIAGGPADMKVSWQVTAVRSDPVQRLHPFEAERWKEAEDRGAYLCPECYERTAEHDSARR